MSQETITLANGQVAQVKVVAVSPAGVKIRVGAASIVEPFSNITQVIMNPPPDFTAAGAAFESGDLQHALTLITSVVDTYRGLPTDWAREAMLMMGDIDLALNHLPEAQAAYTDYQSAYPTASPDDVAVGLAGIDLANNDPASAGQKIAPILDQALKQRAPSGAAAALYGRAFLISGKIREHTGDYSGALEDYLRAAVVFPEDRIAAASAQTAADALRKTHSVTIQ